MNRPKQHLILLTAPEAALIVQLLRAARGWAHARRLADRIARTCLRGLRSPVSKAARPRLMAKRGLLAALLAATSLLAPATAAAFEPVFADGFESGDTRYWTAEEPPCSDASGHVAPLCHWSWEPEPWLAACENGKRCARLCFPNGEPTACVMLLVEQP